jgi:hypothetical protein
MTLGIMAFNSYAECHYAECHLCLMLQLSVIMLSGVMLSVAMPSVMAPFWAWISFFSIGLYNLQDGIANPKYKLLCFLTTIFLQRDESTGF